MAVNYGQMQQRIKNDVNRPSSSNDTAVKESINTAIRFYNGRRLWFLEEKETLTLLNGDSSVALPDDFQSMLKLKYLYNNFWYSERNGFMETTWESLEDLAENSTATGRPKWWALFGDRIYFDVMANDDFTIDISYIKGDVTEPSADGDTSVFFDEGQDLIRYKAESFLYSDYLHDSDGAGTSEAKAQQVYNQLTARQNYKGGRNVLGTRFG